MLRQLFEKVTQPAKLQLIAMLVATGLSAGVTLGSQFALGWLLEPEGFGEIRLMYGYFQLAIPLVVLGMIGPLGQLCIAADAAPRWQLYWHKLLKVWFPFGVLATIALSFLAYFGYISESAQLHFPLAILLLGLPFWTYSELHQTFWKVTRFRYAASIGQVVSKVCLLGSGVMGAVIVTQYGAFSTPLGFSIGFVGGGALNLLFFQLIQQRLALPPQEESETLKPGEWQKFWDYAPLMALNMLVITLGQQIDVVLLDYLVNDPEVVGLFMFGVLFNSALVLIQAPLVAYWLPEMGEIRDLNLPKFFKVLVRYQLFITIALIALATLMYLIARPVVDLLFAEAYLQALVFVPFLLLRGVLQGSYVMLAQGMYVQGEMRGFLGITALVTFGGAFTAYILMQEHGVWGLIYAKLIWEGLAILFFLGANYWCWRCLMSQAKS